ncbi:MAG TPA: glycosyltransferase, partial [Ilumatobacteraceae bacterium]
MIVVVIVTFSAEAAMLDACVASVLRGGGADKVIVVDNGGRATVDAGVDLVRPARNIGFGGGANAGFRRAADLGATAVALLNDDVEVEAGWLAPLIRALDDDPMLGAVQPKLLLAGTDPPRVNSVGVVVGPDGAGTDLG